MRVLIIHNFHRSGSSSGDDQVYKSEAELLASHGHEIIRYFVSNDDFDNSSIFQKVLSTFGMVWSFKNNKEVKRIIKSQKPDIVHIHTFFPLLSPSVLYAAKESGVPVVATLHDTRFICPCATSLRGDQLCNSCADGHYFRMVRYNCFKGSKLKSFIVAGVFKYHRIKRSFYNQIDKYICLNENQIELLKSVGFSEGKIVKKYNFVPDIDAGALNEKLPQLPSRYVVYYGRIGEEKGIRLLMKIWEKISDIPLVVMGSGPLEEEFRKWSDKRNNVFFLGYTKHQTCLNIVKQGAFVVFPSIWYEGCSMVEIEAQSLGKALIASDLGFSVEAISNGENGYKVKLGDVDGFVKRIKELWTDEKMCERMGGNARASYEERYMPEDNYKQLIKIYRDVLIT